MMAAATVSQPSLYTFFRSSFSNCSSFLAKLFFQQVGVSENRIVQKVTCGKNYAGDQKYRNDGDRQKLKDFAGLFNCYGVLFVLTFSAQTVTDDRETVGIDLHNR